MCSCTAGQLQNRLHREMDHDGIVDLFQCQMDHSSGDEFGAARHDHDVPVRVQGRGPRFAQTPLKRRLK